MSDYPTIREIQQATASCFGVTLLDLLSDRRSMTVTRPRQVAMWIASRATLHSLPTIGRVFGRDHTTVMHAIGRINGLMDDDAAFAGVVRSLAASVEARP